jgi:Protein of unknown function (DUF3054)
MLTARRGSIRTLPAVALAVGDAAVFVLWAALGLHDHREGITLAGLGRNAGFVMLGWFAVALLTRPYASARRTSWRAFLLTWAGGVSLGVILRWIALRKPFDGDEFAFFGVTLAVTLVLLLAWRELAIVIGTAARGRPA